MNPDLSKKAVNKIETLCELGCSQVKQLLKKAKQGDEIKELNDFTHTETKQIIDELRQIMSVYVDEDDEYQSDDEFGCANETLGK